MMLVKALLLSTAAFATVANGAAVEKESAHANSLRGLQPDNSPTIFKFAEPQVFDGDCLGEVVTCSGYCRVDPSSGNLNLVNMKCVGEGPTKYTVTGHVVDGTSYHLTIMAKGDGSKRIEVDAVGGVVSIIKCVGGV
ncbi:hypothetical protein ACHAXT_012584 [Thalassiosira profunda]